MYLLNSAGCFVSFNYLVEQSPSEKREFPRLSDVNLTLSWRLAGRSMLVGSCQTNIWMDTRIDLPKNEYSAIEFEPFNSCKRIQIMIRSVRDSR